MVEQSRQRTGSEEQAAQELERLIQEGGLELQDLVHGLKERCDGLERENSDLQRELEGLYLEKGRFAGIYNFSPVGYMVLDSSFVVMEANTAAANLLGTTKEGLIGKSLASFISPDSQDIFRYHYGKVLDQGTVQIDTVKVLPKNGRELYLQLNSLPVDYPVEEIRTSAVDITESVKANYLNSSLNKINMVIHSSMTVEGMMQRVVSEATLAIGMEAGVILFKHAGQWIITQGHNIPERWLMLAVQASLAKMADDIVSNNAPFVSSDTFNDSRFNSMLARELRIRSVIACPFREGMKGIMAFFQLNLPLDIDGPMIDFVGNLSSSISLALAKNEALEAERQERYLLKMVFDNAPAVIIVLEGKDLRIKWANKYSNQYRFGPYASAGTAGRSIDEILSDAKLASILRIFHHVAETGEPYYNDEIEVGGLGPRTLYWRGALVPLSVRDRTASDVMILAVDITDQVLARKRIEELAVQEDAEKRRLQTIIDTLPVGVIICDAEGNILESNSIRNEIWGETRAMVKHIDEWGKYQGWWADTGLRLQVEDWPIVKALSSGEMNSGSILDIERPDHTIKTIVISAAPFRDIDGRIIGAVAITQDITEQKDLEREAVEAKERAELYVDLLTHDVNNMNAGAMGYLQLLQESKNLREKEVKWIKRSLDTLEDSTRLIENVRKIQKLGSQGLKRERIDVGHMLHQIVEQQNLPEKEVVIDFEPTKGQVVIANELLKDVFSNLIGNSIKHSKGPVRIGIGIETIEKNGTPYHRVVVEDNGPGISDQMKEKLFSGPQKGRKRAGGRGLGLYLVRWLVEDFGGQARVEDRVQGNQSQGTRFIIDLPAAS